MSAGVGRRRPAGTWIKLPNASACSEFCTGTRIRDLIQIRPKAKTRPRRSGFSRDQAWRAQSALLQSRPCRSALCARQAWSRLKPLLQGGGGIDAPRVPG